MNLLRRWRRRRAFRRHLHSRMADIGVAANYARGFEAGEARVKAYMTALHKAIVESDTVRHG